MCRRLPTIVFAALLMLCVSRPARAGMPSPFPVLTEVGALRFQTISFFLMLILLCAWAVRATWNALRRDFPRLPRLSYCKALGLVWLWGLLFLIVLTMIAGARELMTPGAWKRQGITYRPTDETTPKASEHEARRRRLESLRMVLWNYAATHEGRFPPSDRVPEISAEAWESPDASGMRYRYAGVGKKAGAGESPLAYEPGVYDPERLVLLTDGSVREMTLAEIRRALEPGKP